MARATDTVARRRADRAVGARPAVRAAHGIAARVAVRDHAQRRNPDRSRSLRRTASAESFSDSDDAGRRPGVVLDLRSPSERAAADAVARAAHARRALRARRCGDGAFESRNQRARLSPGPRRREDTKDARRSVFHASRRPSAKAAKPRVPLTDVMMQSG